MSQSGFRRNFILAVFVWLLSAAIALRFGAVTDADMSLILGIRLPRVLLASGVGMGLAVAGVVLQALFSNPLCEPYTLGISSGASLGAVVGGSLGLSLSYAGLAGTSLLGGLFFLLILYGLSHSVLKGRFSLLLAGVMLGYLGSSLVALWMAFSDSNGLSGALFWLLGDLSRARLSGALFTLGAVLVLSGLVFLKRGDLDALLLGEEFAASLGVPVEQSRRKLMVLSAILVSVCVSSAGMIGFVGLVVPHFVRRMTGSFHLRVLPLACVWGAAALTVSDAVARIAFAPHEIPVGVITALFGVPLFVVMTVSHRRAVLSEISG